MRSGRFGILYRVFSIANGVLVSVHAMLVVDAGLVTMRLSRSVSGILVEDESEVMWQTLSRQLPNDAFERQPGNCWLC